MFVKKKCSNMGYVLKIFKNNPLIVCTKKAVSVNFSQAVLLELTVDNDLELHIMTAFHS